jgi:hypothetical protein
MVVSLVGGWLSAIEPAAPLPGSFLIDWPGCGPGLGEINGPGQKPLWRKEQKK